ncbi:hypothetical protein F183_A04190 [Bryobacterales bacterium F-183]|nr:hypothetical protein F183_A04190 [Bryobacterales bacterium F-183]
MLAAQYEAQGIPAEQARQRARREFGGIAQMQEDFREQNSLPFLDSLRADLVYGLRSFAKTPGVTALIIVTLALGIGANTAIFSFLNELLLRPLPYPESDRILAVGRFWQGAEYGAVAPKDYVAIRDQAQSFSASGIMFLHRGENLEAPAGSLHVLSLQVSEGYFRALGVPAFIGRTFTPEEDIPNGPKTVVLSYPLWQTAFHADPNVAGRIVKIAGVPHTVLGVMPEFFTQTSRARMWLPLQSNGLGDDTNYALIARLKPGATPGQAAAETESIISKVDIGWPRRDNGNPYSITMPLAQFHSSEFRQPVLLLYAGVCLVLLVACLNVANLLIARAASRAKEIALRAALGASRPRIARQMLTESLLIAIAGGVAGIAVGYAFLRVLTSLAPYDSLKNVTLDRTTLLTTTAISLAVGLLFGLAPMWHALRVHLNEALKSAKASESKPTLRGRQALVILQVALCTVMLAGAGLLIRTVWNIRAVDLGFSPANVITSQMALNAPKLQDRDLLLSFYNQALTRIREIPGVTAAGVTTQMPLEGQFNIAFRIPDSQHGPTPAAPQTRIQTRDVFDVFGMRIVQGRGFTQADQSNSMPVAVVNEAFARHHFPNQSAIGKQVFSLDKDAIGFQIVGVVNDIREMGPKRVVPPAIYLLTDQVPIRKLRGVHSFVAAKWVIRLQPGATSDVSGQIRQIMTSLDAGQPLQDFVSMSAILSQTMEMERFLMILLGAFALLTLAMVASGLYGTLSYGVTQRRQEIGIRMAMGASWQSVAGMVVRGGMAQVALGLAIGLTVSYLLAGFMTGFLFGVPPLDPVSLTASAFVLLAVSAAASAGPSWNAVRTDPLQTLRNE